MIARLVVAALAPLDLVELTHTLSPSSPAWPDAPHLAVTIEDDYPQGYFARHLSLPEHAGTHVGVGVDTMSIDVGASPDFAAHRKLLGAGKYGVENLAGLAALPARGATVIVAPLKVAGGSGAPARVFADVPR